MDTRLQEMLDHFEIRNVLALYCHACDRCDPELLASIYTGAESFDDHGIIKASGPEFAHQIAALIEGTTTAMSHTLGQSIIQVRGDEAKAETFFIALMIARGDDETPRLSQLAGRFIDELRRVNGHWKVYRRQAVHDMSATLKIEEDYLATNLLRRGSRDSTDPGVALLGVAHAKL